MKKNKLIITIILFITLITLGGLTYAYFVTQPVIGNSTTNTIVTLTADYGNITVTYLNANNIINAGLLDLKESDKNQVLTYMLRFDIESTATIDQEITIKWKELTNTFCQYANNQECTNINTDTFVGNELSYNLYTCSEINYNNATISNVGSNCTSIGSNSVPVTGSTSKLTTNSSIILSPNSQTYYALLITIENTNTEQNYNQGKDFSGRIDIERQKEGILLATTIPTPSNDNISSPYVSAPTGINFTKISSATNGRGLYTNSTSLIGNDLSTGTIKYYRGIVTNNYVLFGTHSKALYASWYTNGGSWDYFYPTLTACETARGAGNCTLLYDKGDPIVWRITRINSDGSIRLITEEPAIFSDNTAAIKFNNSKNNIKYVGYTYDDTNSTTNNGTPSNLKDHLDDWYTKNLSDVDDYIVTSNFCNDSTIGGTNSPYIYFSAQYRVQNGTPTFGCLTTTETYGGNYNTKIGTITVDEIFYAGSINAYSETNYFLNNDTDFWTMTPRMFSGSSAFIYKALADNAQIYSDTAASLNTVRPVINLSSDVKFIIGDGTVGTPYEINMS